MAQLLFKFFQFLVGCLLEMGKTFKYFANFRNSDPQICRHASTRTKWLVHEFDQQIISSEKKQKCESQNGCYKKTKYAKFFEKRAFFCPSDFCDFANVCDFNWHKLRN